MQGSEKLDRCDIVSLIDYQAFFTREPIGIFYYRGSFDMLHDIYAIPVNTANITSQFQQAPERRINPGIIYISEDNEIDPTIIRY